MAVEIRMSASSSMRWSALDRSADGLQRSVCASFPITASVDRGLDPIAWQAYQIASKLKNHSRPGCQGLLCKWCLQPLVSEGIQRCIPCMMMP